MLFKVFHRTLEFNLLLSISFITASFLAFSLSLSTLLLAALKDILWIRPFSTDLSGACRSTTSSARASQVDNISSGSLSKVSRTVQGNAYSAGVMEIRIAGSSCRRPQLLFDQFSSFSHSIKPLVFFIFRRQPVDSRNKEAVNSTRNTIYSLKVFTTYFIDVDTFYLFLSWFGTRVSDVYKYTKIQGPRFQRNNNIARDQKSDLHDAPFQSSPKINRMLITRPFAYNKKFNTRPSQFC